MKTGCLVLQELAGTCIRSGCPYFTEISEIVQEYPNPIPETEGTDTFTYTGDCEAMKFYQERLKAQKDFNAAQNALEQNRPNIPEECPLNLVEFHR